MAITQNHVINIQPGVSAPLVIHCSQGDTGTQINLTVVNGDEEFDCSSYACSVHGVRSDGGNWGPITCTVSGSTVCFSLTSAMTAVAGACLAEISVGTVGTANFTMLMENATFGNGVTYSNDVSVYQSILTAVQNGLTIEKSERVTAVTNEKNERIAAVTNEKNERIAAVTNEKNERIAAVNAEATARQTADNTLQGNINSEASTRASADSNLQSQINQIVAPSGEAPSAAEVQNARIGADGVTYDTLGTAIRTQVRELKGDLSDVQDALEYTLIKGINRFNPATMNTNMVIARNAGTNYGNITADSNYDTSDYIEVNGGDTVSYYMHINTSYTTLVKTAMYRVGEYDENKNCITVTANWVSSPYTVGSTTKYVRISFAQRTGNKEIILNGDDSSTVKYTPFNDYSEYAFVKDTKDAMKICDVTESIADLLWYSDCGRNKLNPEEAEVNKSISNSTETYGDTYTANGYTTSGYITAKKGDNVSYYYGVKQYSAVSKDTPFRIAEYDENKTCLTVTANWTGMPYTVVNAKTAYIRMALNKLLADVNIMITVNEVDLSTIEYEPFTSTAHLFNVDKVTPDVNLVIPAKVPCVVNMPLYVYNRAISYGYNDYNALLFSYNNYKNKYWINRTRVTPTSEGTTSIVVNVFGEGNNILANGIFSIVAVDNTAHGSKSTSVLIIGDSKTEARYKGDKLKELIDADNNLTVTFLGTQQCGEIHNEGYSGKSIIDLCRTASFGIGRPNIFYDSNISATNKFSFSKGVTTLGATPDIVFIDMGANDWNLDWADVKGCYDSIIESIHSVSQSIKVVVSIQEGVCEHLRTSNFNNDHSIPSQFVGTSSSQKLIAEYDDRESENIFIIPQYLNVDPMLDYPICDLPISEVNPMRVPLCVDVIHPGINNFAWSSSASYKLYDWIHVTDNGEIIGYACAKANTNVNPLTDDGTNWVKCENANAGYYKIAYMYYYMLWYLLTVND